MSRQAWYFLVALAFGVHNLEEAVGASRLLTLMQSRAPEFLRGFYAGISVPEIQTSLCVITALGLLATVVAARRPDSHGSAYAMLVFAGVIGVNALAHVALTLVFRGYMPGLGTALLVTLPLAIATLIRARRERWVSSAALWSAIPVAFVVHGFALAAFIRASIGVVRALRSD